MLSPQTSIHQYPVYHSLYETFELVDEIYDPGFIFQAATVKIWAGMAMALAEEVVRKINNVP